MDSLMTLLFDKSFLVTAFVAILAFATIVTLGMPMLERGGLGDRLHSFELAPQVIEVFAKVGNFAGVLHRGLTRSA